MTKPIIKIHDVETNEVIEREMNDVEYAQYQTDIITEQTRKAEAEAQVIAKAALLAKLGITEEEAKLLLS